MRVVERSFLLGQRGLRVPLVLLHLIQFEALGQTAAEALFGLRRALGKKVDRFQRQLDLTPRVDDFEIGADRFGGGSQLHAAIVVFGGDGVGTRGGKVVPRAAEQVDLVGCTKAEGIAVVLDAGGALLSASTTSGESAEGAAAQWRVRIAGVATGVDTREQRRASHPRLGCGLGNPCGCFRNVEIVGQGIAHQCIEHRIVERGPPCFGAIVSHAFAVGKVRRDLSGEFGLIAVGREVRASGQRDGHECHREPWRNHAAHGPPRYPPIQIVTRVSDK